MPPSVAPIAALLLGTALVLMGNGLLGTLLPVRGALEGFSDFDIGLLGSAYYLGFASGCFVGARVVVRAGHIRTFAAVVAIASSTALAHAIFMEPAAWWVFRGITGCCFAVLFIVIESWLNDKSGNETRGFVFAVYLVVNQSVIAVGQTLIMLGDPRQFVLFAVASMLISLAAVPVALTRSSAPDPIDRVTIRIRRLYGQSPVAVVGCFAVGLTNGAFWSLSPVYAQEIGGTTQAVALFMMVAVIAGASGQWPLGRLSDLIDRRKVIVGAAALAAAAGLAIALLVEAWTLAVFGLVFVYGFGAFPLYSVSVAHMNDFVERGDYVETAGGLLLVFAFGAVAGPMIASVPMALFGVGSLFAYTAVVHTVFLAFALYRMTRRAPASAEDQGAFADAVRVAQTVSTVDPLSPPHGLATSSAPAPSAETADNESAVSSARIDERRVGADP